MIDFIYRCLPVVFGCHCIDERSFHFRGRKFPICSRCTGELVGIVVSLFLSFVFIPKVWILALLMAPMVIDGFAQALTSYKSNNKRRFITGFMFGYGIFTLFIISTIAVFMFGVNIAKK